MKHCFFILFTFLLINTTAQTVHYTHRTARFQVDDGVIIVPEVGGKSHLWVVSPREKIRIQVYDRHLDWEQEELLPFKISENDDITILPLKKDYYLYNQTEAGDDGFLWKIDVAGKAIDESSKLKAIVKASFKDSTTLCQMLSQGENIYIFSNIYYPDIKKIVSTVIKTNSDLEQEAINRYAFDYDHRFENLHKIIIDPQKNITVLKKETSREEGYVLNVTKINLQNNRIHEANFNSNTPFSFPELMFNSSDSSTTIYSQMGRAYYTDKIIRNIFFATLNDTLGSRIAPTVIKHTTTDEMLGAFTCLNMSNGHNSWMPVHGTWNSQSIGGNNRNLLVGLNRMVTLKGRSITVVNATSFQPRLQSIHPDVQLILPPGDVKFSVIDQRFKSVRDTVIKYHKRNFIEVAQYSSFVNDNNNYLVVKEQFPSKGKGLLLMHINKQGDLVHSPLRLYERFHYSLPQLQAAGKGKIMIPYVYRGEVGLVNMSFDANEP